jgi:hypothetical protein
MFLHRVVFGVEKWNLAIEAAVCLLHHKEARRYEHQIKSILI